MKYKWLNKKNNNKLIIFFNGWGMDEVVVNHLETEDFDVIMFYDYNNLEIDLKEVLEYKNRYLIAWSMGVMVGTLFDINPISSTAINGTLKPIDTDFGIHPKIYDLTIKGFNESGREKFIQNMFAEKTKIHINRTLENQKSELSVLKSYTADKNFKYTKIIISDKDKIIPTKSQCAYWNIEPNINGPHCIFKQFSKWSELL